MPPPNPTLRRVVNIDGVDYMPGSIPPAEIAKQITDPKNWTGGVMPEGVERVESKTPAPKKEADPPKKNDDGGKADNGGSDSHPMDGKTNGDIREAITAAGGDAPSKANRAKLIELYDAAVAG